MGDVHHRLLQLLVPCWYRSRSCRRAQLVIQSAGQPPQLPVPAGQGQQCVGVLPPALHQVPPKGFHPVAQQGHFYSQPQRQQGQTSRQHPNHSHPPICAGAPAAGLPQPAPAAAPSPPRRKAIPWPYFTSFRWKMARPIPVVSAVNRPAYTGRCQGVSAPMFAIWKHCPPGASSYRN